MKEAWRSSQGYVYWASLPGYTDVDKVTLAQGYESYGITVAVNGDIRYREWAPNAVSAHFIGDFSKLLHLLAIAPADKNK
jgi:hypothetical protein